MHAPLDCRCFPTLVSLRPATHSALLMLLLLVLLMLLMREPQCPRRLLG
jgi:hypothetical protein